MIYLMAFCARAVNSLITWSQGYTDSTNQTWHSLKGAFYERCLPYTKKTITKPLDFIDEDTFLKIHINTLNLDFILKDGN